MAETTIQTPSTRGDLAAADVSALLRARNPLLWVVTREEARAEKLLYEAAARAGYVLHTWDCSDGACEIDGRRMPNISPSNAIEDMMTAIKARAIATAGTGRDVWVLRDLPVWLNGPMGIQPLRQLRNLARTLSGVPRNTAQAIIVLTTDAKVPEELSGHATVIEWPLPDRNEIAAILDMAIKGLPDDMQAAAAPNGTRDAAIDAAVGLTAEEAAACYARSLVQYRKIDPVAVAKEKKRVIARERVLEWSDPLPGGLSAVGGLENLKTWLIARKNAYSAAARTYGLPLPKGILLIGIPGCGKSLTAKAISTAFGVPLLRLDLGALKSKFVGESEGNLRKAFKVIEALGRCVIWIDEVEKALAGATQGGADGGVSSDALGAILSWMQERQGEAFVIATANDVTKLPPELLRKGRFDEIFFVDLPNELERVAVLEAALRFNGRADAQIDREAVARECREFTGSEIAAIVPDALFTAFGDESREITTEDLIAAARTVTPLAKTASDKISALREWAKGKARPASIDIAERAAGTGRQLDLS